MQNHIINRTLIGTFFEYFDFVLFTSAFPVILVELSHNTSNHMISQLSLFCILSSFWLRPIFGYLWGSIADRYGLGTSINFNLLIMGVGTLLIGLTPAFHNLFYCLIWVALARVVQIIAFSGEFTSSVQIIGILDVEKASWLFMATAFGGAAANGLVSLFESGLSWRVPFIVSGIILLLSGIVSTPRKIIRAPDENHIRALIQLFPFALCVILFQLLPTWISATDLRIDMLWSLIIIALVYILISSYPQQIVSITFLIISGISAISFLFNNHFFFLCICIQSLVAMTFHTFLIPTSKTMNSRSFALSYQVAFMLTSGLTSLFSFYL